MDADAFYDALESRIRLYGEQPLAKGQSILISADPDYVSRLDGQAALLTLSNLLGRMSPRVFIDAPRVPLRAELPWRGDLVDFALGAMRAANPHGLYEARKRAPEDYIIRLGRDGADWVVHGEGWNAYVGPAPSPLPASGDGNPLGAAFAAVMAGALIFKPAFPIIIDPPRIVDVLRWRNEIGADVPFSRAELGSVWIVGAGSVGSAAAYFLTLAGLRFQPTLFDMDIVKIENITRSPIFREADAKRPKVDAVHDFLADAGITAGADPHSLRESGLWAHRPLGTPDLLISAANEDNVRYEIEQGMPPLQIFGTTGSAWQSAVLRLTPMTGPCSCCVFPPEMPAETACATDPEAVPEKDPKAADAALPFLSFAAGLMTVIEIAKLALPGYPFSDNTAFFQPLSDEVVMDIPTGRRAGCFCADRSTAVHRKVIAGSRFAALSDDG